MNPIVFQCFRLILECSLIYNLFIDFIDTERAGERAGLEWSGAHAHIFTQQPKIGKSQQSQHVRHAAKSSLRRAVKKH